MKYCLKILSLAAVATISACGSGSNNNPPTEGLAFSWQNGSNESNAYGSYGTLGIAAANNQPGARLGSISWVDEQGNFWLFGGAGNSATESGSLNDLWEYRPSTKQWVWVNGSNSIDAPSSYGESGVAISSNMPGARYGGVSWRDGSGNLWMFGGFGKGNNDSVSGFLNDLWEYNPNTNVWTWQNGSNNIISLGVYGVKGVGDTLNTPSGRIGSATWTDKSGNLWLFGGVSGLNTYNDLWKYSPHLNQWTWVSGDKEANNSGIYGVKGVGQLDNHPGARLDLISWMDNDGNLWLFGGAGIDGNGSKGLLNDLWKFNPNTNVWTWMSGSDTVNQSGTYGVINVATATNTPGARDHRIPFAWSDKNGDLWMTGGFGFANSTTGLLNDLWKYTPANNQWTWMAGSNESNAIGSYGTLNTSSTSNYPGARRDAIGWIDNYSNLWIFGGVGNGATTNGKLNDLWKFSGIGAESTFPVVSYTAFPGYQSSQSNYITGVRGITDSSNVYISVIWPSTSTSLGLIYAGPLDGVDGNWYQLNYPTATGATVKSTTWYGPNNGNTTGTISVVGSYTTIESGTTSFGMLYQGGLLDGNNPTNWTQLSPPNTTNTIAHSNMGELVVGNYAINNESTLGNGFIYNITSKSYFQLSKQGAISTTIYGIWHNGGTSYTIAGGYSSPATGGLDTGYIADFDSSNNAITNWTDYSYNNQPLGNFISHFEGITSNGNGGYNLVADVITVGAIEQVQPVFVQVNRIGGALSPAAKWTDVFYPGASPFVSGNTVFESNFMGVYKPMDSSQVNSFIANVPTTN